MTRKGRIFAALCVTQALFLTVGPGSLPYAYAAPQSVSTNSEEGRLIQIEKVLFGEPKGNGSLDSRVRTIEENMFGKARTGSINSRLDSIDRAITAGKSNLLAPPQAPQLDTRQWNKAEQPQDNYAQNVSSEPIERATESDRALATLKRASEMYAQGRIAEAEKLFRNVINIDRNNTDAHFNLGAIAESKGDLNAALRSYKTAHQINPNDPELRDAVASVERKMQDGARAQEAERQQVAENRKRDQLKGLVAEASAAYKAGQYDAAARKLEQVVRETPNDPDVRFALGQALKAKGDIRGARPHLEQALAQKPNNQLFKDAVNDLHQRLASNNNQHNQPQSRPTADPSNDTTAFQPPARAPRNPRAPSYPQPMQGDYIESAGFQPMDSPAGQITPFTGNRAFGQEGFGGGRPGMFGNINGSAVKRGVIGGLAGAAIGAASGAMFGRSSGEGLKRGAINGALKGGLIGGAIGLFTGGF